MKGLEMSLLTLSLLALAVVGSPSPSKLSSKIRPNLSRALSDNPETSLNIFIEFSGIQKVLAAVSLTTANIADRGVRNTMLFNALTAHASESQVEARALLESLGISQEQIKSFWINNHIFIKGADKAIIQALALLPSVTSIEQEIVTHLQRPIIESAASPREPGILAEWNIEKMRSHLVWDAPWGNNGSGVVVGFIDTGVRGTHEAIRDQYMNDGRAWRDPYNQYSVPTDIYNHGTHTVGSVVGKFGIGSAPAAKWIACKGYQDDGGAELSAFTECGQYMVCPTDSSGQNPDCTKTPHVTSNSWGVWPGTTYFEDILDVWRSSGIISVFSNGNEGPTPCGDLLAPADSAKTMGVGATGRNDELASFSSRGPSRYGVLKPDISAPGMSIRSCDCNGDSLYSVFSGTSMSCPNSAGVIALMVGKDRAITYDRVKSLLESTATTNVVTNGETCGNIPDNQFPNNHVGHGRIDAYAAVEAI
jgi:hypothetical protein